jgi:hypothetical protein
VISVHKKIYVYSPPWISEQIVGNLKTIAYFFIEGNFSYIRVFKCSISPHALPKFLPDRLVCREVSYQTVIGGIGKELKEAQKKFWPTFPLQVGRFSLPNFGHSKVEVAALEDLKLVDIKFRRHDPYQIVGNHLAQCNMKTYEHEDSPYEDIFKGIRDYEEVLDRVQTLSPNQQASFFTLQRHRRSGLPKIIQGESIITPPKQGSIPTGFEPKSLGKHTTEESPNNLEVSSQGLETSQAEHLESQTEVQSETLLKQNQVILPLSPATPVDTSITTEGTQFTEVGSPITTLTHLQSSFRTPSLEVIYASDLAPIPLEEMLPSKKFFSTKRRAIVKRESQQKEGILTKRQRMIFDGQGLEDSELAKEMVGSLSSFSMENQWSIDKLE